MFQKTQWEAFSSWGGLRDEKRIGSMQSSVIEDKDDLGVWASCGHLCDQDRDMWILFFMVSRQRVETRP